MVEKDKVVERDVEVVRDRDLEGGGERGMEVVRARGLEGGEEKEEEGTIHHMGEDEEVYVVSHMFQGRHTLGVLRIKLSHLGPT